ncbi:MAG: Gx transporter family protein [Bacillota bacterium]|jgi:heptaprenyl diphosphate synthase|nr:Gx transporter family protein [Eubacteriales bacterium]MDI9491942.1 Gx transporter family protein [Bacillota bacterium]NLV70670.1 Gx transporter family protein [Clostridiales bacterium]HPF18110.1 Gx transporter family protein [Bacillota bacterium]
MNDVSVKHTPVSKKIPVAAILASLALIFSYLEFLFPLSLGIPGIKPGLANIVVVVALYKLGSRTALMVNLTRILLAAALFGSVFSGLYALSGGLVSFAVMTALRKTNLFSTAGVSMAGGVFHNLAQLAVAALIVESSLILYYFPLLLLAGMAAGLLNGVLATWILRALRDVK